MDSKRITQQLIELEQLLVQPATRLSAKLLNCYLADDFYEIAATGRCFGKADVLARLTYRATIKRAEDEMVNYSMRSSTYRFDGENWQMLFHQGTACEPF